MIISFRYMNMRIRGYLSPASFSMLLSVPVGISALCLGTANCLSVTGLYQMSCRLPLRTSSHFPFLSILSNSCVFMFPPFYDTIITRINTCVNKKISINTYLFPFILYKFSKLANFIQLIFSVFITIKVGSDGGWFLR